MSDQKRKIILKVLVGSRAHNLHTEDSDFDYRGVFIVPTTDILALGRNMKNTNWVEGKVDATSWELGHFLDMATHCNPNILDVFEGEPIDDAASEGRRLQELWPAVISRRRILDAYLGYSHNQFKKMMDQEAVDTPRVWKFGVTYIRSLLNGIDILETGTFSLEVDDEWHPSLQAIREGHVSRGVIVDMAVRLQKKIHEAYGRSIIPEAPDLERVNAYLLEMRKKHWRLF